MTNNQEPKKCYCARCFLPIDTEDKVDVGGQNFHNFCSTCCICRTIPKSLKMFYGHVFCNECFKTHVVTYKGESPRIQSNSWWMQWGPGTNPNVKADKTDDEKSSQNSSEPTKKLICARCLQPVDESHRLTIGEQSFHSQCGQCYICRITPTNNLKIYCGNVFCEECFHRHVLNRNRDNPSEFFKNCFEQWQNNPQFAENMRDFMTGNKESSPFIFMMQGHHPPFCRCGTGPQEWFLNEPKRSATPAVTCTCTDEESCELCLDNRTEVSIPSSAFDESTNSLLAAEKIEKLTKYLHEMNRSELNSTKTWKFLDQTPLPSDSFCGWIDIQDKNTSKSSDCPKCLWQSGPIFVTNESFRKVLDTSN